MSTITKTPEAWQSYISTSLKKTAQATLETAERIAKYKASCEPDEFNKSMSKWFNFSPSHLSYWQKIDEYKDRFTAAIDIIPAGSRALYELAGVSDDIWDELIETKKIAPSLTVEAAKSLKNKGGVVHQLSEKFSDADNYLEIMTAAASFRQKVESVKEFKHKFEEWLKKNPPAYGEDDEELVVPEEDDVPFAAEPEVIQKTSQALRIKCLATFGIYVDKPITDTDILTMLDKLAGNSESKLACVEVLENE